MTTVGTAPQRLGALFEPIRIGELQLPNRIVMAPMGTCLDESGEITADTIAYYVRRAAGGVGAITVEGCLVSEETEGPEPKISSDRYLPGLARLGDVLRERGVVAGVQLMHPGRQVVSGPVVAPSAVPLNSAAPVPHELSTAEIAAIVEDYAAAAVRAREAGFRFVEVHGAHGYLPSNFLSPLDNRREDGYGGDLEGRTRFSVEVARAIVTATDGELPLVWRINGEDAIPGGFQLPEAVAAAQLIEAAGAASISVSAGTWRSLHVTLAPMFVPRGSMLPFAAAIREAVDVPVMAVGRLDDPELAGHAVATGEADLICIGRGLIAEPDWAAKVSEGRLSDLRPCIACNACVDLVGRGERARCSVNPEVGRELTWGVRPAAEPRDVMVVGSGPAGLEAARVARLRGHRVSLWERSEKLGGKLEVAGLAPSKAEVLRFRDYQVRLMGELGVEIHTGVEVTPERIAAEGPDAVIVAVGAEPLVPPIPGIGGELVHDAVALLHGEVALEPGRRLAIVGGSATGCELAEMAVAAGCEVTILELRGSIGHGIEAITRRRLIGDLRRAGVAILTTAKVVGVDPGAVLFETDGEIREVGVDLVALALGWRSGGSALADALEREGGLEIHILGDALAPADFVHAINSGADAGLIV
jgi:2,4-dienoyl-CoA reductase-like NADH-dependent reductase (Old Yellow Enzyme family)/thioredoxin reductase